LPGEGTAADTTATPPRDAGERARELLGKLGCWQRLYSTAKPIDDPDVALIAAALQSARTAAASQARRVIEMWDPRGDRWDDVPYDNPTIKALMLRALATPQESA
jgi:hypothetical protein